MNNHVETQKTTPPGLKKVDLEKKLHENYNPDYDSIYSSSDDNCVATISSESKKLNLLIEK